MRVVKALEDYVHKFAFDKFALVCHAGVMHIAFQSLAIDKSVLPDKFRNCHIVETLAHFSRVKKLESLEILNIDV